MCILITENQISQATGTLCADVSLREHARTRVLVTRFVVYNGFVCENCAAVYPPLEVSDCIYLFLFFNTFFSFSSQTASSQTALTATFWELSEQNRNSFGASKDISGTIEHTLWYTADGWRDGERVQIISEEEEVNSKCVQSRWPPEPLIPYWLVVPLCLRPRLLGHVLLLWLRPPR